MPALTIKNIPDDVYRTLKQTAEIHRRSINSAYDCELVALAKHKTPNV
jgi:plasmid stability protein